MGLIVPIRRESRTHLSIVSDYLNKDTTDHFKLQQLKSKAAKKGKPLFRISTRSKGGAKHFWEIAHAGEEGLKNEWNYIKDYLEGNMQTKLNGQNQAQIQEWYANFFRNKFFDEQAEKSKDKVSSEAGAVPKPKKKTANSTHVDNTHVESLSPPAQQEGSEPLATDETGYQPKSQGSPLAASNVSPENNRPTTASGGQVTKKKSESSPKKSVRKLNRKPKISKKENEKEWVACGLLLCVAIYCANMNRLVIYMSAAIAINFFMSFYVTVCANIAFKLRLFAYGFMMTLFSTDKKWKKTPDPDQVVSDGGVEKVKTKRIYFLRHGESEWNLIFNKGVVMILPRLIKALIRETLMMVGRDSILFDSPLNKEGLEQAKELSEWLDLSDDGFPAEIVSARSVLRGEQGASSVLVSSPLRRAIGTATVALRNRLSQTAGEKIHVLSSLTEVSFNVDTISLADDPGSLPDIHSIQPYMGNAASKVQNLYDADLNEGNKPIRGNGLTRLDEFAKWCFEQNEDYIIVGGHSLYFRYFFKTFLPHSSTNRFKKEKIANTGIVSFVLEECTSSTLWKAHRIQPDSIVSVYEPETKKSKKTK